MNLDINNWKPFLLKNLFIIKYGVNLELNACDESIPEVNFVSRTAENNGVSSRVLKIDNIVPQKAGLITVAGGGSVLSTFLQNEPFYSGRDLYTLECKENITDETKLFLITLIEQNKYKYSYGRQANKTMPDIEIVLPIKRDKNNNPILDDKNTYSEEGYMPDWEYMDRYIKSLHHKPLSTKNSVCKKLLNVEEWEDFLFTDIFYLKGGFYNKKPEHSETGRFPFLGSTESNNGVTELYSLDDIRFWDKVGNEDNTLEKKIFEGNCIAVTVNGSVCNAFYQAESFTCSHDITAFYLKNYTLNPMLAIFLCTIIMQDKYRWSYGRKPHDIKKFGKSIFKLPIKREKDGAPILDKNKTFSAKGYIPDWEYMEKYIRCLPYGDRLE